MKLTIFAHNGQVSAIAFPNEASNYNGVAVMTIEVPEGSSVLDTLASHGIAGGVGSPYNPTKVVEAPKPATKKK